VGAVLPVKAKSGDWWKVEAAPGRTGWVRASDGSAEGKAPAAPGLARAWREPPKLAFAGLDLEKSAVVTDADHLTLGVTADDATGVMDVRVFVDNEKVFFHTAKSAKGGREQHVSFQADLPLKSGNNQVLVVAREDGEFTSQRTIVVHRRGPNVAGRPGAVPATP
jgi:carboxyl-terminal processing protease